MKMISLPVLKMISLPVSMVVLALIVYLLLSIETDDNTTRIIAAGLSGITVWLLQKILTFMALRSRLLAYLVIMINERLIHYQEMKTILSEIQECVLKKDYKNRYHNPWSYQKDDLSDIAETRLTCLKLLTKTELERIAKLLNRGSELEYLIEKIINLLPGDKMNDKLLEESDVKRFQLKLDRILSYINKMPKKIQFIDDLPVNYTDLIKIKPQLEHLTGT